VKYPLKQLAAYGKIGDGRKYFFGGETMFTWPGRPFPKPEPVADSEIREVW